MVFVNGHMAFGNIIYVVFKIVSIKEVGVQSKSANICYNDVSKNLAINF
jgi:hypothetical protein